MGDHRLQEALASVSGTQLDHFQKSEHPARSLNCTDKATTPTTAQCNKLARGFRGSEHMIPIGVQRKHGEISRASVHWQDVVLNDEEDKRST